MKSSRQAITEQIRVILADDHSVVRQGLGANLNSQKDIKIVAEAADGEEMCELYDQPSRKKQFAGFSLHLASGYTYLLCRSDFPALT